MKPELQKMIEVAKTASHHSHSPYSNFPVGACVLTKAGELIGGCNVENASYPAGQCAEATALGTMVCQHGGSQVEAVLVYTPTDHHVLPCGMCLQKLGEFMTADSQVFSQNLSGEIQSYTFKELLPNHYAKSDLEA